MPIEFRCHQCGKLLRTADDTAGKQAKCPSCGAIQPIPAPRAPEDEAAYKLSPAPPLPAGASPFARAATAPEGAGNEPAFGFSENPYASPTSLAAPFAYRGESYARTGPPWEQDGASFASFIETVKLAYGSTAFLFGDMRREGGLGAPLGFGMAGGMAGGLVGTAFQIALQVLVVGAGIPFAGPPAIPGAGAGFAIFWLIMAGVAFILLPISLIVQMFVSAGIWHLMLMMLGGARQGFETTFRVVAYSTGNSYLFSMIPFCGGYINIVAQLVFVSIGLTYAHEISAGKAVAAVLLPAALCCGLSVVLWFSVLGFALLAQ